MKFLPFLLSLLLLNPSSTLGQEKLSDFNWPTEWGSNPKLLRISNSQESIFTLVTGNDGTLELWKINDAGQTTLKVGAVDQMSGFKELYKSSIAFSVYETEASTIFTMGWTVDNQYKILSYVYSIKENTLQPLSRSSLPSSAYNKPFVFQGELYLNYPNNETGTYRLNEEKAAFEKVTAFKNWTYISQHEGALLFRDNDANFLKIEGTKITEVFSGEGTVDARGNYIFVTNNTHVVGYDWMKERAVRVEKNLYQNYHVYNNHFYGLKKLNTNELRVDVFNFETGRLINDKIFTISNLTYPQTVNYSFSGKHLFAYSQQDYLYTSKNPDITVFMADLDTFEPKLLKTKETANSNFQVRNGLLIHGYHLYQIQEDSLVKVADLGFSYTSNSGYYFTKNYTYPDDRELFHYDLSTLEATLVKDFKTIPRKKLLSSIGSLKKGGNSVAAVFALNQDLTGYDLWRDTGTEMERIFGPLAKDLPWINPNTISITSPNDNKLSINGESYQINANNELTALQKPDVLPVTPLKYVPYKDSLVYLNHAEKAVVIAKDSLDKNYRVFVKIENYDYYQQSDPRVLEKLQIKNLSGMLVVFWSGWSNNFNSTISTSNYLYCEYKNATLRKPLLTSGWRNEGEEMQIVFENEKVLLFSEDRFVIALNKLNPSFNVIYKTSSRVYKPKVLSSNPNILYFISYQTRGGGGCTFYNLETGEANSYYAPSDRVIQIVNEEFGYFYSNTDGPSNHPLLWNFKLQKMERKYENLSYWNLVSPDLTVINYSGKDNTHLSRIQPDGSLETILESPKSLFSLNESKNELIYLKTTEAEGTELWAYSLDSLSERLLYDALPGPESYPISFAKMYGDSLYFVMEQNKVEGPQLWLANLKTEVALAVDASEPSLTIYPNPSSGSLQVAYSQEIQGYRVIDQLGKTVKKGEWPTDGKVDIENLPLGSYILLLESKGKTLKKRFLVMK